jgi:1-acyl-sn-glycerol-3-phosphate acyltransferase
MASTPAEAEPGPKRLALPEYRPWFYDIVWGSSAVVMRTVFRMTAEGVEHIPREGGVVLAPMHRSYFDTLAVGVPIKPRRFRAMAKYELFLVPLLGRAIALGGGFPVKRSVQDMEAYETAVRLLQEGELLLVFPEGTRNRDGNARPQLGAARLAIEAGAAFVPVAIAGSDGIRFFPPRLPQIRLYYGEPVQLDDLPTDDLRRASHTATKRWMAAIEAGLAVLRR